MADSIDESFVREMLQELRRSNMLTIELIRAKRSWWLAIRQGILTGLGGVIGATLVVSFLIWMLQPLQKLQFFKPTLDRIAQELERRPAK